MFEWVLVITLHFEVGTHKEPQVITGDTRYNSLESCAQAGQTFAELLGQDFVLVEWYCPKFPKVA